MQKSTYRWMVLEDLNAFFGLMLDNVTNLVMLTGILVGVFHYPEKMVFLKMIPGTALGVLFGDLVYTWMAIRLAKKTGKTDVTAMPLGLDTPSTIGIAFAVLGPVYVATGDAMLTWYVGMATMIVIGVVKVVFSFFGGWIQRIVPQAGLLGSLAGIGLALLAFLPLLDVFKMPVVGLASLGIIIYTVVANNKFPGNIPAVLAAVMVGTIIYYILGPLHLLGVPFKPPEMALHVMFPLPTLGFWNGMKAAIPYIPIAIPFGILTIVGGINVTESARVAGDDYNTRDILLTEAVATLIAGLFGGVAQSTPYIGHPAYKEMGGRAGYTFLTGLFIGIGGILGYISFIVDLLPVAAVAPILIFIGLVIITQAFQVCPDRHAPAVGFAFLPIVADLVLIEMGSLLGVLGGDISKLPPDLASTYQVVMVLGHGFILTGMLWGAIMALVIDHKLNEAIAYLMVTAGLTFFGVIHSVMPNGNLYLPWLIGNSSPYLFTAAYVVFAAFLWIMKIGRKEHVDALAK